MIQNINTIKSTGQQHESGAVARMPQHQDTGWSSDEDSKSAQRQTKRAKTDTTSLYENCNTLEALETAVSRECNTFGKDVLAVFDPKLSPTGYKVELLTKGRIFVPLSQNTVQKGGVYPTAFEATLAPTTQSTTMQEKAAQQIDDASRSFLENLFPLLAFSSEFSMPGRPQEYSVLHKDTVSAEFVTLVNSPQTTGSLFVKTSDNRKFNPVDLPEDAAEISCYKLRSDCASTNVEVERVPDNHMAFFLSTFINFSIAELGFGYSTFGDNDPDLNYSIALEAHAFTKHSGAGELPAPIHTFPCAPSDVPTLLRQGKLDNRSFEPNRTIISNEYKVLGPKEQYIDPIIDIIDEAETSTASH